MRYRTRAVAALSTAAVVAGVGPAAAHPAHHYEGRCTLRSVHQDFVTGDDFVGVLAMAYAATTAASLPAPEARISATCEIRHDGVVRATVTGAGRGVAAGVASVAIPDDDAAVSEMCERVTVAGDVHDRCQVFPTVQVPPQHGDPVDWLLASVPWGPVDAAVCEVLLAARAAGVPGIDEEGDVYVAGERYFDCPPYDVDWG